MHRRKEKREVEDQFFLKVFFLVSQDVNIWHVYQVFTFFTFCNHLSAIFEGLPPPPSLIESRKRGEVFQKSIFFSSKKGRGGGERECTCVCVPNQYWYH